MTRETVHGNGDPDRRVRDALDRAKALARQERWREAASLCESALAEEPRNADALHMLGMIAHLTGQLQDAEAYFRRAVGHDPANPDLHHNLGTVLLSRGRPQDALDSFKSAAQLDGSLRGEIRICRNSPLDPARAAAGTPYIQKLADVLVETCCWSVIDGNRIHAVETMDRNPVNNPFVRYTTGDYTQIVIDLPAPARSIGRPCIFLGGDEFYAHWLLRCLARLALVEERDDLRGLPVLANDDLRPYQRESLALLGYDDDRLVRVPRGAVIDCSLLYVPTQLRTSVANLSIGIEWLRRRLLPRTARRPPPKRRLFVSRGDAPQRHLSNEAEILASLAPFDLEAITPGSLDFERQIRTFAEAELVVGAHGAGLTNLVYAPADCRVIEISSRPISHMADFRMIAEALGQGMETIVSDDYAPDPDALREMHADFRVDPAIVRRAVETALRRPR